MDHGAESFPSERIGGTPGLLDQEPTPARVAGGTSVRPTIIDSNPDEVNSVNST